MGGCGLDSSGWGEGSVTGSLEYNNELFRSINCNFLTGWATVSFARRILPYLVSSLLSLWTPVAALSWNSIECRAIGGLVLVSWGGVRLSPLIGLLYQPWMIHHDECGAVSGMRIGRRNRSTRRKPAPVPLFPPQIPQYLTWARTQTAAVRIRRLTASDMTRPNSRGYSVLIIFSAVSTTMETLRTCDVWIVLSPVHSCGVWYGARSSDTLSLN
jgi:hypothetical protein